MKDFASTFAQIIKTDKNPDGTLTVYGKATDDSLDIDQQIADNNWLEKAMPEWFMTGGNIREQHSNIAAGVAKEYEQKADGHYIRALVVDPTSVRKVEAGVLKGFSIGIRAPRIVRDTKAVNGRIVDGQIVEVSLVDRPANPNCQLVLAKTAKGKKDLVKVEEMKYTAKGIVEDAKKFTSADTVKFDKELYEKVRLALASLIAAEANEMITEGHNEEVSLQWLLGALHNLFAWYEHEEAEGEVAAEEIGEVEMSAESEVVKEEGTTGCTCEGCKMCKESGGCDMKMCKGHKTEKELVDQNDMVDEKSAEGHKCLECGCGIPQTNHGLTQTTIPTGSTPNNLMSNSNVSTATMVSPTETPKSIDTILPTPATEEVGTIIEDEDSDDENSSEKSLLANLNVTEVIEKAVKSALVSVEAQIAELKSAKEAVENKAVSLEQELATAKSLAIGGGPKRTTIATGEKAISEWKVKSQQYFAKAASTEDPILAKGYREMAKNFLAKAEATAESK